MMNPQQSMHNEGAPGGSSSSSNPSMQNNQQQTKKKHIEKHEQLKKEEKTDFYKPERDGSLIEMLDKFKNKVTI